MANMMELSMDEMEKVVGGKHEKGWEYNPTNKCPAGCTTYRIRKGDTMKSIAAAHGTDTAGLLKLNPKVANPNQIVEGFWLIVPAV